MNLSCFLGGKESWNHWFPQIDSDQVRAGYQDFSSFASLVHPAKLRLNTQLPKKCQSSAKIKVQSSTNHAWSDFHLHDFNPWNPDFSISLFKGHVAITVLVHLHRGFQKGAHILEIAKTAPPNENYTNQWIRLNEQVKFEKLNLLKSHDLDNNHKRHADTITSMNHGLESLWWFKDYKLHLPTSTYKWTLYITNLECTKCQGKSSFSEYTALQNIEFPWCILMWCSFLPPSWSHWSRPH